MVWVNCELPLERVSTLGLSKMPIYEFSCDRCKLVIDIIQNIGGIAPDCPNCGVGMTKKPTCPAMVKIKGKGYPSRRKWAEDWTPDSPAFKTGSLHGEKY